MGVLKTNAKYVAAHKEFRGLDGPALPFLITRHDE
jgi:hypothetical protein